jgi:hypothetical protein
VAERIEWDEVGLGKGRIMRRAVSMCVVLCLFLVVPAVGSASSAGVGDRFEVDSVVVQVRGLEFRTAGEQAFAPVEGFAPTNMPLDLVKEDSFTELLLEVDPNPGVFDALRLIMEPESIIVSQDGETREITDFKGTQGNGKLATLTVIIVPDLTVVTHITADLKFEFDWKDAFVPQGDSKSIDKIKSFRIQPLVTAVNASTTGTLEFRTYSDSETPGQPFDDAPLADVAYGIFDDTVVPSLLVASGVSSSGGFVDHPGIPAGMYRLNLMPPFGYEAQTVASVDVIVANLTDLGVITLTDIDLDDDGHLRDDDCNDDNDLWWLKTDGVDGCALAAYECTYANQVGQQCLPTVSDVETQLADLHESDVKMNEDKFSWASASTRPGRPYYFTLDIPWDYPPSQKHLQSIQYIDAGTDARFIVTSLSDEPGDSNNEAAVQLTRTYQFGVEGADLDAVVYQQLLKNIPGLGRFNHPGGAQLIGEYLFLALEDLQAPTTAPATGVWLVDADAATLEFQYTVPTHPADIPDGKEVEGLGDRHQATTAVTRLDDGTFLLASCVYEECDFINFFKSRGTSLADNPSFAFVDQWHRSSGNIGPEQWSDCPPQNMNFVTQEDGALYLVMFGGEGTSAACGVVTHDDYVYGYKVEIEPDIEAIHEYDVSLVLKEKVDVIPNDHSCWPGLPPLVNPFSIGSYVPGTHGLNFLAGSGVWLRPDGKDTIAILATEHYDSCGSTKVNGKSRWGVSDNWK